MRIWRRLLLAGLAASLVLGGSATASPAEGGVSGHEGPTFRGTWGTVSWEGLFSPVRCTLTLEGSFHSAFISKVINALVGYVSAGRIGTCAQGAATVLTETLPWHVRYRSFTGTLPAITNLGFTVTGASFRIRETSGFECLLAASIESPMIVTVTRSTTTWAATSASLSGRIAGTGAFCVGSATISGLSTALTRQGAAEQILISLI